MLAFPSTTATKTAAGTEQIVYVSDFSPSADTWEKSNEQTLREKIKRTDTVEIQVLRFALIYSDHSLGNLWARRTRLKLGLGVLFPEELVSSPAVAKLRALKGQGKTKLSFLP